MNNLNEFDTILTELHQRNHSQESDILELTKSIHQCSLLLLNLRNTQTCILIQQLERMSTYLCWDLLNYLDYFDLFELRRVNKFFKQLHQSFSLNIKLKLSNEITLLEETIIIQDQDIIQIEEWDTDRSGSSILAGVKGSIMVQLMELQNPQQETLDTIIILRSIMDESIKGPNDWNTLFKYLYNHKWSLRVFYQPRKQLNQKQVQQLNRIQYIKIDKQPQAIKIIYKYFEYLLKESDTPARKKLRQYTKYIYLLEHKISK